MVADGVAGALVYALVSANPTLAPITDLILVNSPIAQILATRRMLSVRPLLSFFIILYCTVLYCTFWRILDDNR